MIIKAWNIELEAIDLSEHGIKNYAFDLPYAIAYMCEAVNQNKLILGGDIIVSENGCYTESYDNWYSNQKDPQATLKDALYYLSRIWKNFDNKSDWKVSVVISE